MIPARQHLDSILEDAIDQSVGSVNAPGPIALQVASQGFRLAYACKGRAHDFFQQLMNSFELFAVLLLPITVVFKRGC